MTEKFHCLDTRSRGHWASLGKSFLVAIFFTLVLFGTLAAISTSIKMSDISNSTLPLQVSSVVSESSFPESKTPPKQIVFVSRPVTVPVRVVPSVAPPVLADVVPPVPATIPDPIFDWDELDWDNPFAEKSKPNTSLTKKESPSSSKKNTFVKVDREKEKRKQAETAARRQATLAKKIVHDASVVSRAKPRYPKSARRKKQEGRVIIMVTVGPSGRVTSAQISRSSQVASLDSAALSAARKFRFSPAKNGLGQTVATQKAIPFTFKLNS